MIRHTRRTHRAGLAVAVLAAAAMMLPRSAAAGPTGGYTFQTIDNSADPTFNQLLGINNSGTIAGYFGSGAAGHPNKGYTVTPPYGATSFVSENFPGSVQTQVTGLNNAGVTVGFWSPTNLGTGDANNGFVKVGGTFTTVNDPLTNGTPAVNQLLGVNDHNVAVGFYVDSAGNAHGYTYAIGTAAFSPISDPIGVSTTATAINNAGMVAGFFTDAAGVTHGFLDNGGVYTTYDAPGATSTMLLGLNNLGEAVGVETTGGNALHGIILNANTNHWAVLDDPMGIGTTTFNGINDLGQIVGFYVDGAGNTDGLLATPEPASLLLLAGGIAGLAAARRRGARMVRPA